MGHTLVDKILGAHGDRSVKAGDVVVARVDFATVAASALTGRLTDPREVAGGLWRS